MTLSTQTVVRTVGLREVQAKLVAAKPRLTANNVAMVTAMLEYTKPIEVDALPFGPGHFGYHAKDTIRTLVTATGFTKVIGQLRGAVQAYWREYGTRAHYRGKSKSTKLRGSVGLMTGAGGLGEPAFMTAHKALSGTKSLIKAFYGGQALWWRL